MNPSGTPEFDGGPIMTWTTTPFRFPAVAHVCRATGHDQVVPVAEEHVAAGKYEAAVFDRRQIDVATRAFQLIPIGYDLAVDAQPRDATVRENLETKMRDAFIVLNWERILRIAAEWHLRKQWDPRHGFVS